MRRLLANKKTMCVVATLLVANAAPTTMAWAGELPVSKAAASAASPQINPQQKQDKEISRTARAFVQYFCRSQHGCGIEINTTALLCSGRKLA